MPPKKPKPATCRAYVAKSGRIMLPYTVRITASEVWRSYTHANGREVLSRESAAQAYGITVVPILMTEILRKPRTKRKGK